MGRLQNPERNGELRRPQDRGLSRPTELGAADDLEQVVGNFNEGANSSLDIAVQEIDALKIAEAIITRERIFNLSDGFSPG